MARLREFDTDVVLDSAMQAFWLRGDEATSLADLMAATGLKKCSICKAFSDKHSLFILALRRYLDQRRKSLPESRCLMCSGLQPLSNKQLFCTNVLMHRDICYNSLHGLSG